MKATGTEPRVLAGSPRRRPAVPLGVMVVHDLVTAIVTGEVKPGELLPTEAELCEHFGVSRTVIRESIKRLEEKGMIHVVQGRGTLVTDERRWNILDHVVMTALIENDASLGVIDELSSLRAELEAIMARDAAVRRTEEQLEELRQALRRVEETVDDADESGEADIAFHGVIMTMSGQIIAKGITRRLVDEAIENSERFRRTGIEARRLTIAEHRRVLEAIEAGDATAAATAMHDHITRAWSRRRLRTPD